MNKPSTIPLGDCNPLLFVSGHFAMPAPAALKTVLCIDDQSDLLLLIELWLGKFAGIEVRTCTSGRAALKLAADSPPDLVLLDMMMPDLDGLATLAALRANPATANLPVILMTADDAPEIGGRLEELGVLGILTKPFNPLALRKSVAGLWARHQMTVPR